MSRLSLAEVWSELSFEERAEVGPLTRVRLGLSAKPMSTFEYERLVRQRKRHDDDACEADPCNDCVAAAVEVCDPIQEV